MNWMATFAVAGGMGIIVSGGIIHASPVIAGAAAVLGAVWIGAVWGRWWRERALTWLAFGAVVIAAGAMYTGVGMYPIVGAVTLIVTGWEAGLSAREIAPFPAPARRAFVHARIPLMAVTAAIGFALGAGLASVRLHLSFGIALGLAAAALTLMAVFLIVIARESGGQ